MIASWWAELSLVMKILWGVTLAASSVFIIQSIFTFVGADADSDFDLDSDSYACVLSVIPPSLPAESRLRGCPRE